MTNKDLLDDIKEMGQGSYRDMRVLEDGTIVGIGELMFTRAIYMDMHRYGWGRRFCFEDKAKATEEYAKLTSGDDEPVGWTARR